MMTTAGRLFGPAGRPWRAVLRCTPMRVTDRALALSNSRAAAGAVPWRGREVDTRVIDVNFGLRSCLVFG